MCVGGERREGEGDISPGTMARTANHSETAVKGVLATVDGEMVRVVNTGDGALKNHFAGSRGGAAVDRRGSAAVGGQGSGGVGSRGIAGGCLVRAMPRQQTYGKAMVATGSMKRTPEGVDEEVAE